MTLGIYTIEKTLFDGEVKEIVAKTTSGEITILANHIPLITRLAKGSLRVIDSVQKEHLFSINSGFLEVRPESKVIVLVDVV